MAFPGLSCLLILPGCMVALLGSLNLACVGTTLDPGHHVLSPLSPMQTWKGPVSNPQEPSLTSFNLFSQGFWALRKPSSAVRLSRKPPSTGRWKAPRCQVRTRSLSGPCSFSRTSRCSSLSRSAAVKKACQAFSSVPYWGPADGWSLSQAGSATPNSITPLTGAALGARHKGRGWGCKDECSDVSCCLQNAYFVP